MNPQFCLSLIHLIYIKYKKKFMTKTNLNPNSSNFSRIKAMFEGLTTNNKQPGAFEAGLNSVTNTTTPEAKLPSPKATSPEGEKSPPVVRKKTAQAKKEYERLKQKHEANLLSKPPLLPKPRKELLEKWGLSKSPESSKNTQSNEANNYG